MKKLKLCKECEITSECETLCQEAVEFEKEDHSDNYMQPGEYKNKDTLRGFFKTVRIDNEYQ